MIICNDIEHVLPRVKECVTVAKLFVTSVTTLSDSTSTRLGFTVDHVTEIIELYTKEGFRVK